MPGFRELAGAGRVRAVAPKIVELEALGRSLKCEVFAGRLDGAPVVAKVLVHRDPIWRWYFEREARVLSQLPRPIAAPALLGGDIDAGVLILSHLEGRPLARQRRVAKEIDGEVIDAALAIADRVASVELDGGPPPPRGMRLRLLEDPTAPRGWFVDGVDRCRRLGLIGAADAAWLDEIMSGIDAVTQHGDLLPRNILRGQRVWVIDWECAGPHLRGWDRALLWANLGPGGRARVEATVEPEHLAGFRALCAFALAREAKFARAGTPSRHRLEADLAAALCRS